MKALVLYVSGLSHRFAVRPDIAEHLSRLIEHGSLAPLFPVFPVLPRPMQATFLTGRYPEGHGILGGRAGTFPDPRTALGCTRARLELRGWGAPPPCEPSVGDPPDHVDALFLHLDSIDREAARRGPAHPSMQEVLREVDRRIGELSRAARDRGAAIFVLSDGAPQPAETSLDIADLTDSPADVEEQICHIRCGRDRVQEVARRIRARAPQVRILCTPQEKRLYRIDHPDAGDVVLIAPPSTRFGPAGPRATRGRLPADPDDLGIFVTTADGASTRHPGTVRAVEVASCLKEALNR